jgi:digeranylgeranylglycerophospholipid reductase
LRATPDTSVSDRYDVVISGGGPAGLAAAARAAAQGARTVVVEREKEIGGPVHTSGGSWITDMRSFGIPERLYHPITRCVFLSPNRESVQEAADACVIDVRGVYQHLATQAVTAGAQIRLRHTAKRLLIEDDQVVGLAIKNHLGGAEELRAPITIDATGFSRGLTARAGKGAAFRRYAFGAEYDIFAPHYPEDTAYLIMGTSYAPNGYGWIFPHGNHRVRVGAGVIHPDSRDDARRYLDVIMGLPQLGTALRGASQIEYHTGLFPSEPPRERSTDAGLILTGDAAGHGSTLLGEGIRFAVHSGHLAGDVAAAAIANGDVSATALRSFDQQWDKRFGRSMRISSRINRRLAAHGDADWDRMVDRLDRLTVAQTEKLLRSECDGRSALAILRRQPGLITSEIARWLRTSSSGAR